MTRFAEQVLGLMDHLNLRQAVVGGTSLGANVSLELGVLAPRRATGLVIEMPVLETGVYGAVMAFTPLGRIAPDRELRQQMGMPVLVIGHHHDPTHPYADAEMLAGELPNGRLIEASSIFELRLHPERLSEEIGRFLDQVSAPGRRAARSPRRVA